VSPIHQCRKLLREFYLKENIYLIFTIIKHKKITMSIYILKKFYFYLIYIILLNIRWLIQSY